MVVVMMMRMLLMVWHFMQLLCMAWYSIPTVLVTTLCKIMFKVMPTVLVTTLCWLVLKLMSMPTVLVTTLIATCIDDVL